MSGDEFSEAARAMRRVASEVGPQHAWWDVIFDLEAVADGRARLGALDATSLLADARRLLDQNAQSELKAIGVDVDADCIAALRRPLC